MGRRELRRLWNPRILLAIAVPLALNVALVAGGLGTSTPPPRGYVFDDEFDTGALNTSWWSVETPWHTQTDTSELARYDPANVTFPGGGIMRIASGKQTSVANHRTTVSYPSGMVSTGSRPDVGGTSRVAFTYGYFEMRAKLPKGKGVWPAFWLTNDNSHEIDVMEMLGDRPNKVYMTLHHFTSGRDAELQSSYTGPDFSADYHTFAVDWQPTYVRYYIDGVKRAEFTENVPSDPLWIVCGTAIGGRWPGNPYSTTVFPQYYDIDYIRVRPHMPSSEATSSGGQ